MNYLATLKAIMSRRSLNLFKLRKELGVTLGVLQDYLAGMPIDEPLEAKITNWIDEAIA